MPGLKQRMAENGFECNESYEYVLTALRHNYDKTIPCLNVQGDGGRRKTAFANALANSQDDISNILYHDFTVEEEPIPAVVMVRDEDDNGGKQEPAIGALDRILSDACAYSEGENTVLILDQLQAADFKDHIRLYKFLTSKEWTYNGSSFYANSRRFTLYIISEEQVYHSLQKHSYKVWVDSVSDKQVPYKPADFGLGPEATPVMQGLASLFEQLMVTPTFSEYQKILGDIPRCVHTAEDLANTVFGWTEGVERDLLRTEHVKDLIQQDIMPAIETYIGVEEVVELSGLPVDDLLH